MFSPYRFLRLGQSLSKSSAESRRRTAIGRLYYACFLKARENLLQQGALIGRYQSHKAVITKLRHTGQPQANMLKLLKVIREHCDYDLSRRVAASEVTRALTLANHIWPTI